jgi:hypothetical protein
MRYVVEVYSLEFRLSITNRASHNCDFYHALEASGHIR